MTNPSFHNPKHTQKTKWRDQVAKLVITSGGFMIITAVVGIMLLIASVSIPLFYAPAAEQTIKKDSLATYNAQSVVALGVDEYQMTGFLVNNDGRVGIFQLEKSKTALVPTRELELFQGRKIISFETHGKHKHTFLLDDGSALLVQFSFRYEYDREQNRSTIVSYEILHRLEAPATNTISQAILRQFEGKKTAVLLNQDNLKLTISTSVAAAEDEGIFASETASEEEGSETSKQFIYDSGSDALRGAITALAVASTGEEIYLGRADGSLTRLTMGPSGGSAKIDHVETGSPITALGVLFGDSTVIVGGANGSVSGWFNTTIGGTKKLTKIRDVTKHDAAISQLRFSTRDKTIISEDREGAIQVSYFTSAEKLFSFSKDEKISAYTYAPRGDGILSITEDDQIKLWALEALHPEINFATLFSKVWYENYQQPEYVWQSTGGSDEFESKLSLVPLIFGTLKATFFAMIFALPLAILGAVYLNQFASPRFRNAMKSVIELMAALPSVVIGFLAALWLAPLFIDYLSAIFVAVIAIPIFYILFIVAWHRLRRLNFCKRFENGFEFVLIVPVIVCAVAISVALAPPLERYFFGGSISQWFYDSFLLRIDQRNSIVISVALGFAVIPLILSISEDSLSSVPRTLSAGSLALGASRWQTVWRIMVPSASPGIFAATMIGFGRAVGETMIVLMATGNTPIMDMSIFNGMRTLAANVAVEIPEAPVDGTLYRTLFLCATLLFCMTFFLNTVAELVRQRLRKKYARF